MVDYRKLYDRYMELKGDRKMLPEGASKIIMREFDFCCKSIFTMEMDRAKKLYRKNDE